MAVHFGRLDVVQELLKSGADPNMRDLNDMSPLLSAITRDKHFIVEELLSAGADYKLTSENLLVKHKIDETSERVRRVIINYFRTKEKKRLFWFKEFSGKWPSAIDQLSKSLAHNWLTEYI